MEEKKSFLKEEELEKLLKIEKRKKKRKRLIKTLIIRFVSLAIFLVIMFHFVVAVRVLHDNDMYPLLADGQAIVVFKLGKIFVNEPVLYETSDGIEKIGRIVAQGGDEVNITEEGLYVNGNILYTSLPYETKPPTKKEIKVKVPEGSYYILNDYRERMTDSRTYGCISDVKGVVIFSMKYRGL